MSGDVSIHLNSTLIAKIRVTIENSESTHFNPSKSELKFLKNLPVLCSIYNWLWNSAGKSAQNLKEIIYDAKNYAIKHLYDQTLY